jgi:hypothetical protein
VDWGRFAQQMVSMARDLLAQESVDATLARITASATELVEGCDAAGILVLHEARVETLAPTDQLVIDNDQLQQRLGEGPCFDAARSSQGERVFCIADLTGEQQRWPAYSRTRDHRGPANTRRGHPDQLLAVLRGQPDRPLLLRTHDNRPVWPKGRNLPDTSLPTRHAITKQRHSTSNPGT